MQRRSFLAAILAAGAAPMIVKAGVLMPVRSTILPQPFMREIWISPNGQDQTAALQAAVNFLGAQEGGGIVRLSAGLYLSNRIVVPNGVAVEGRGTAFALQGSRLRAKGVSALHAGHCA